MSKANNKQEDNNKEYLKRVNSPIYMKRLKKNMELLKTYKMICNPKLEMQSLRSAAKYFTEDIKNPIPRYVSTTEDTSEANG